MGYSKWIIAVEIGEIIHKDGFTWQGSDHIQEI